MRPAKCISGCGAQQSADGPVKLCGCQFHAISFHPLTVGMPPSGAKQNGNAPQLGAWWMCRFPRRGSGFVSSPAGGARRLPPTGVEASRCPRGITRLRRRDTYKVARLTPGYLTMSRAVCPSPFTCLAVAKC